MEKEYQLIILGGGPAGLTAGIYAARNKINTLLIEKAMFGGLAVYAESIENYPGFPDGVSGMDLGVLMLKQAEKFGLQTSLAEITELTVQGQQKVVTTTDGKLTAKAVIVALGSERINLNVPGEKEFVGRGVSYCATCDAAFFRDKTIAVVGGGNSAVSEALHLAKFASRVNIIHRRNQFRATPLFLDKAKAEPKISFVTPNVVEAIQGNQEVEKLQLKNCLTGQASTLPVAGVFVAIGQRPNTELLKGLLPLDAGGYIVTNEKMETAVPGIFAAGDIRGNSIRQTISAAGDGATAAIFAGRYIEE
jgi:thioredoxin reductase (NADPH)